MKRVLMILIVLVILAGIWLGLKFIIGEEPVACTMDAKLCPDGSYVGRVPPKCDFAPCPEIRTIKLYYYNPDFDRDKSGNIACSRN